MLLDVENQYSVAQVVAAGPSDNVIDHIAEKTGLGAGAAMAALVIVGAVTAAADITVEVETSADEAFTVPVVIGSRDFLAADIVEGERLYVPIHVDYKALRYTRVTFSAAGFTADVFLTPQVLQDQYESFKNNSTIS